MLLVPRRHFSKRYFSKNAWDLEEQATEVEIGSSTDEGRIIKEASQLMMQYRLVPVAEHPLFPGASQALQITAEQYELLRDDHQVVFASVVKNDEILKRGINIFKAM